MTETTNYKLTQWAKDDRILMEDFNDDNAKIDAALKAQESAIATKAATAALNAETAARTKADADEAAARKSADAAETAARTKADADEAAARKSAIAAETAARTSAVNALNAAVAKLGNCQLYCGTYTGTGKGTSMSDPRTYTFPHPPRMVVLSSGNATFWWAYGATSSINSDVRTSMAIQQDGENGVRWWSTNANYTMDRAGTTYTIMALLEKS